MKTTIKYYSRRDSATAVLRKLGINSSNYDKFITRAPGGDYAVHVEKAKLSLKKPVVSHTAAVKKMLGAKDVRRTISSVARELIKAGKTDAEVWATIKHEFHLDDSKKRYPAWYRADLLRHPS